MSRISQGSLGPNKYTGDLLLSSRDGQPTSFGRKPLASTGLVAPTPNLASVAKELSKAEPKSVAQESVSPSIRPSKTSSSCLVCRKGSGTLLRPCSCSSKFMHDSCLVEHLLQILDKPCSMCGVFYQSPLIISRARLQANRPLIAQRNEKLFRALLGSITGAFCVLLFGNDAPDLVTLLTQRMGQLVVMPFAILAFTILLYNIFQLHLQKPSSGALYFRERSRVLTFLEPATRQEMNLYIRSLYGMLVDNETGTIVRVINKHVGDTAHKWRLHRLMEP